MSMIVEVGLSIVYILLFAIVIRKWNFIRNSGLSEKWIWISLGIKIFGAFSLLFVYTHFYKDHANADLYKYFSDGNALFEQLKEDPGAVGKIILNTYEKDEVWNVLKHTNYWYRQYDKVGMLDNRSMIRINFFIRFFSFGFVSLHTLVFSFLSFLGSIALFRFFTQAIPANRKIAYFSLFLLPSFIFWTSAGLKETWLVFSYGFLFFIFGKLFLLHQKSTSLYIGFFVFICFGLLIRPLFLLIALLFLLAFLWNHFGRFKYKILPYITCLSLAFIILLIMRMINPQYDIFLFLVQKNNNFIAFGQFIEAGSLIDIPKLENNIFQILINIPVALYNMLFRPYMWEAHHIFSFFAAIENLFLMGFALMAIIIGKIKRANNNFFMLSLFFVLASFSIIGLVTPVVGAMVRYKTPFLPFFMIMMSLLIENKKYSIFEYKIKNKLSW